MNKNFKLFNSRYHQIVGIILILMAILALRLFVVTVFKHEDWAEKAAAQNTKILYTPAPRGNIYDRYGRPLAVNRQIFSVNFNVSSLTTEEINDSSYRLINILQNNGEKFIDNFGIKIDQKGEFYYTFDEETESWLKSENFPTDLTPEQAFAKLRSKYRIDFDLDRYEALKVLQDKYSVYPPISVKKMVYTPEQEKERFLTKFGYPESEIKEGVTAKECFKHLRDRYMIDESLSDEEARKIFIVRNEIATNGFTRYLPIKVASNIGKKTIAYLEETGLPGVEVVSESKRYYPNGTTACHILGYMGSISESEADYYIRKLGYSTTDLVGKDGLEASMEETLHGRAGIKKIRVNSSGEYVETLEETPPVKGADVFSSADLDLQRIMEETLKENIEKSKKSRSGAAVAVDVKTGQVLAMASYPTFDPNIFAGGISYKAWESVQPDNPRDSMSPSPLWNNAVRTAVAPGSAFKPITALTALECGLDPKRRIYDKGVIRFGGRTFGCDLWNNYRGSHGYENLEWGLGNSCNYYFYCIATGKDWGTGASLGYDKDISVEKIIDTAKKFGLGSETGIELYETVRPTPSAEEKLESMEASVRFYLYDNAHRFFPKEIADDYDRLKKNLYTISGWTKENPDFAELIRRIDDQTDVLDSQVETVAERVKFDYFIQADWGTADLFNTSIGQGYNAYTPIQIANYLATLANGGFRNKVTLLEGVEGLGPHKTVQITDLGLDKDCRAEVLKGMKRVCKSGTLAGVFKKLPVEVAGKTGTAENQSIKQPKSEVDYVKDHLRSFNRAAGSSVSFDEVQKAMNEMMDKEPERFPSPDDTVDDALIKVSDYKISQSIINSMKEGYEDYAWTVAIAPADDPKIAVVAMLIEGGYSYNAAPVVRDIMEGYFNLNREENEDKIFLTENGKNVMQ